MMDFDKNSIYYIKAGCNYALSSIDTEGKITTNKSLKRIDLDYPSVSIEYVYQSITQTIDYLFSKEISPNNIYLVSDLSQIGRFFKKLDYKFKHDYYSNNEQNQSLKLGDDFSINYLSNAIVDLNGTIFDYMIRDSFESYSPELNSILVNHRNLCCNKKTISYVEEYLETLTNLQDYLNKSKVEYSFYMMNNLFQGWVLENDNFKHIYSYHRGYSIPDISGMINIWDLSEKCSNLFSKIDLKNICFYSTKGNEFGGMDEFAVDNYKIEDWSGWQYFDFENGSMWGMSPRQYVRNDYFNRYIKNSYIDFLDKNNHL